VKGAAPPSRAPPTEVILLTHADSPSTRAQGVKTDVHAASFHDYGDPPPAPSRYAGGGTFEEAAFKRIDQSGYSKRLSLCRNERKLVDKRTGGGLYTIRTAWNASTLAVTRLSIRRHAGQSKTLMKKPPFARVAVAAADPGLFQYLQVVGGLLVNVVIEPVGIEQMGMGAPVDHGLL
jgi:hypothetical protein